MIGLFMTYDPDADAIFVSFRHVEPGGARGVRVLDESRNVEYDYDDEPVGVEFLNVSDGINLEGLPRADEIRATLERLLATHLTSKSAA